MNKPIPSVSPWQCILVDADIQRNTNRLPPSFSDLFTLKNHKCCDSVSPHELIRSTLT